MTGQSHQTWDSASQHHWTVFSNRNDCAGLGTCTGCTVTAPEDHPLYEELTEDKHPGGRPNLRYNDVIIKGDLKDHNIDPLHWQTFAEHRYHTRPVLMAVLLLNRFSLDSVIPITTLAGLHYNLTYQLEIWPLFLLLILQVKLVYIRIRHIN